MYKGTKSFVICQVFFVKFFFISILID